MMPLMTHQSPAPMPMLLASGVEPALMSTVPRPMANPSMLSRNWTAMIRTTPPKMADQEMRRWIWEPPTTSVVVVSTAPGDLGDGESKVLVDIHASYWEDRVNDHPGGVAIKISGTRTRRSLEHSPDLPVFVSAANDGAFAWRPCRARSPRDP